MRSLVVPFVVFSKCVFIAYPPSFFFFFLDALFPGFLFCFDPFFRFDYSRFIPFHQAEYPKLSAVLFGEGVLNDAMSILLFQTVRQ